MPFLLVTLGTEVIEFDYNQRSYMRKMGILEGFGVNVNRLNLLWMAYTCKMVFSFEGISYVFLEVGCSGVSWWRFGWSYRARQDNSTYGGAILLAVTQTRC